MRKLPREERLRHPVIVLLKQRDLEELKIAAAEAGMTQGAWARAYVMRGLERAKKNREAATEGAPEASKPVRSRRRRSSVSRTSVK